MDTPESGIPRPSDSFLELRGSGELPIPELGSGAVPELVPEPLAEPAVPTDPSRVHLVVVVTRAAEGEQGTGAATRDAPPAGVIARYWQPRDRQWMEQTFESLEHVLHLFVDELGWLLRQQQPLDAPQAHELIFETRREDVAQPSATEVLEEEVGLDPKDVAELLQRIDQRVEEETGGS